MGVKLRVGRLSLGFLKTSSLRAFMLGLGGPVRRAHQMRGTGREQIRTL